MISSINYSEPHYHIQKVSQSRGLGVSFCGHLGHETIKYLGKDMTLINETAFFRECETLNFLVDYLNKTFGSYKEKSIVVGACSTGEEVYSIKMLLKNSPAKIIGIDLSPKAIEKAKSGVFQVSVPINGRTEHFLKINGIHAYSDGYLGAKNTLVLSEMEKKNLELFNGMFEQINADSFLYNLDSFCNFTRHKLGFNELFLGNKLFKLKLPQKDCSFMVGGIENITELLPEQKHHAITFRNALYHIAANRQQPLGRYIPRIEIVSNLDKLFKKINKSLYNSGLFIIGDHEQKQGLDLNLIKTLMGSNGFKEIPQQHSESNIWQKVAEL